LPQGIDSNSDLIFTTDGAVWIRQMIEERYPRSTSILDIYHLIEHLGKYVVTNYKKEFRKNKLQQWKESLIKQGGEALIEVIKQSRTKTKQANADKKNLIKYLEGNAKRIDYPSYIKENYYIGSGAIESAHRHVIQTRMKKAGQLWSQKGADRMIDMRVIMKNDIFDYLFKIGANEQKKSA
jgi:hypothetical protein